MNPHARSLLILALLVLSVLCVLSCPGLTTITLGEDYAHPAPAQGCYVCAAGGPTLEQFLERASTWADKYGLTALRLMPLPRDPMTGLHDATAKLLAARPDFRFYLTIGGTADDSRATDPVAVADFGKRVYAALGDLGPRVRYLEICNEPTSLWAADLAGMVRYHLDALALMRSAGVTTPILFSPDEKSLRAAANAVYIYRALDWHSYSLWADPDPNAIRRMPQSLRSLNDENVPSENRLFLKKARVRAIAVALGQHALVVTIGGRTFTLQNPGTNSYLDQTIELPAEVLTDCVLSDTLGGYWLDVTVCRIPTTGEIRPSDYFRWLPDDWLASALTADNCAAEIERFTSGSFTREAWGQDVPTSTVIGESGLVGQVNPAGLTAAMTHAAKLAMLAHLPVEAVIWNGLPTADETPIAVGFSICARILAAGHLCRVTCDDADLYVVASSTGILIVNAGPARTVEIPGVPIIAVELLYPLDGRADNAWTMRQTGHVRFPHSGPFAGLIPTGLTFLEIQQ